MNPVIQRELREQARTPALFRMRLAAAGILVAALGWAFLQAPTPDLRLLGLPGGGTTRGSWIFLQLHRALALTLVSMAPALTADALARERREATFGLLGLTPLTPLAIAVGKCAAHALKALTVWLAPVPVLTVPLLLGGVSALEIATVVTFQGFLLALGLAAGLLASSLALQFRRALALAFLFEFLFISATLILTGFLTWILFILPPGWIPANPIPAVGWLVNNPGVIFGNPFASPYSDTLPEVLARLDAEARGYALSVWALGLGAFACAATLVGAGALRLVALRATRALKEEPPRPGVERLRRTLSVPVLFPSWVRGRQRQRLNTNPLMWLQHRTVAAALTRWGWLTAVIGIWMVGLSGLEFSVGSSAAPLFLLLGMTFSAAGGFRAERENGTLELLLVTPLTPRQILQSRCLSHLREFLPPVILQLFLVAYAEGAFRRAGVNWAGWNWWLMSSLGTLPWIGLWRGFHARSFLTAVVGTAIWALLIPLLLSLIVKGILNPLFFETPLSAGDSAVSFFIATRLDWGLVPATLQIVIAVAASASVWRELSSRQFALGTAGRA
ncbi:MAG: hypothetical protein JNL10_16025 [Verrucomicrobiales bacterium]|nr:hypothetical protein [Verrucomicrobiales bacterium]